MGRPHARQAAFIEYEHPEFYRREDAISQRVARSNWKVVGSVRDVADVHNSMQVRVRAVGTSGYNYQVQTDDGAWVNLEDAMRADSQQHSSRDELVLAWLNDDDVVAISDTESYVMSLNAEFGGGR